MLDFEEFRQLLGHGAAQLFGVCDGHGAPVVMRDVVADTHGDQLHRRVVLDGLDGILEVLLQLVAGVHEQR